MAIGRAAFEVISDTEIVADGVTYSSWQELMATGYYDQEGTRCRTLPSMVEVDLRGSSAEDVARQHVELGGFGERLLGELAEQAIAPGNQVVQVPVSGHITHSSHT